MNKSIWGFSKASSRERAMGRFMRSDEGHGDAAIAGDAGTVETGDGGAGDGNDATQPDAGSVQDEGTVLGAALAEAGDVDAGGDGKSDDGNGEKPEGDAAAPDFSKPYEGITAPEGFEGIDADALSAATPLMREFGVPDEKAQDFISKAAPIIQGMVERQLAASTEAQTEARTQMEKGWVEQMRADPEYGGANFDKSVTLAAKAMDKFFPADFRQLLDESRLGQHPAMLRGLAAMGKMIADDDVIVPGSTEPKGKAHPLYGSEFLPPEQRG